MILDKIKNVMRTWLVKALRVNIVENVNHTQYDKNCLMLYITHPFIRKRKNNAHQNIWQTIEIARIIGKMGYNVDVVDYDNQAVRLSKKYDLIFDICPCDEPRYTNNLKNDSKKIVYFTGSNSTFANAAEMRRLKDLEDRRGVTLIPQRQAALTPKSVEHFNAALFIGNEFNLKTYHDEFCLPKTYLVPNTGCDFGDRFDMTKKKNTSFLFLGSAGQIHKGLDLLLEVFAAPGFSCKLYVCGAFKNEVDFAMEYRKELYKTANIEAVGFVDIWGDDFARIASECAFSLLPSCSEGCAGAVVTAMSAGIIPICSRECGYEDEEIIELKDCTIETIRDTVLKASEKSQEWTEVKRNQVLQLSQTKYSREAFTRAVTIAFEKTLQTNEENIEN